VLGEKPQTVLIVTALDVETKAVLRHLGEDWTEVEIDGTVYYRGKFEAWDVVVVEAGPGNPATAVLTAVAAAHFRPDLSLFVGIAGGVKDVALGDVVVATKVHGYESGKDTEKGFESRPTPDRPAHAVTQRARAMRKRNEWRKRLDAALAHGEPDLFVEPIAAGEKVVASQESDTAKLIKERYGDAVAVEMEGRGFLEAGHVSQMVSGVIRGISDLLSNKATSDRQGWQKKAADAASAVAFEMLHKLAQGPGQTAAKPVETSKEPAPPAASTAAIAPAQPERRPILKIPHTLNEATYFDQGEVLSRVGVPKVDEVLFSFQELPDGFIRVIPRYSRDEPLRNAELMEVAANAPLLKSRQYGAFHFLNKRGAFAYDPGGPHRGGPAPLSWGTQLFPNGELWLVSNTVVVRERGGRPEWIPIPFIPAMLTEQTFHQKAHAAVAFAESQFGLTFPADIQFGVLGLEGAMLVIQNDDMRGPIQAGKVIYSHALETGSAAEVDAALLEFFNRLHDTTGHRRPSGLFHFPPDPPHA
jgi:nucleoside phosphorylase